ncbi:MAG: aKG-HExxH-type peptide beta-hydroxylase [Nitrospiraceae bacterium]
MLPQMKLFDSAFLSSLVQEFRASMRGLVSDLCDDLRAHYRRPAAALRLPVDYVRSVGNSLKLEDYSNWKVVGWIEELNDLVYFLDVREQLRRERNRQEFAEEFLAECELQFYENTYLDDLFPNRRPDPAKLPARLSALCTKLARSVTQESWFLVPDPRRIGLVRRTRRMGNVPLELGPNFERAELPGCLAIGLDGARVRLTGARVVPPEWLRRPGPGWPAGLTLGPALIYGRDRTPSRVAPAPPGVADRVQRALAVIEQAWPDGAQLLGCLTSRIIPLKAKGVVSFSYRHRPGLSFINCFDRDDLDLIDDLIHENSHHHLNLLLRKYVMYRDDDNQEIFYSPWRRSLRPLRGILHAAFTFTMGAILFERLSSFQASGKGQGASGRTMLTEQQLLRARFRCLEEVESVRYSLKDLESARKLGWLTPAGWGLVSSLKGEIEKVGKRITPYESAVLKSKYGAELKRHWKELAEARNTYGPNCIPVSTPVS